MTERLTLDTAPETVFADLESRVITGLAVPAGEVARSRGRSIRFAADSITWAERTPLLMYHSLSAPVGRMTGNRWSERGLEVVFAVSQTAAGDEALVLASDGVLGLSVGVDIDPAAASLDGDVLNVTSAAGREISLTPVPAFAGARIDKVSLHDIDNEGWVNVTTAPEVTPVTVTLDTTGLGEQIASAITATLANAPAPQPVPLVQVAEEAAYRFDGQRFTGGAKFDFAADLRAAREQHNAEAEGRVLDFISAQFATATTDVTSLNPPKQRQDLYVDRREYRFPLWAAVQKETIGDVTPLVLPKYNTSSGLINPMTEGVEPAPGSFTVTSQTITPSEVGGKVELTRTLWDQSGPRVSNLIYEKMLSGWYEALEAKVVAVLDAASPTGITLTTGGSNKALSGEIAGKIADLQFIRGGFAFDTFAAQVDLYRALATAVTDTGEPLFPQINPVNRNGTASPVFSRMNVHGVEAFPAWALAATGTVAASSYLFDRSSIYAAASAPQRLSWDFGSTVQSGNLPQVSMVTLGIHGYSAAAILDLAGVRELVYDPA